VLRVVELANNDALISRHMQASRRRLRETFNKETSGERVAMKQNGTKLDFESTESIVALRRG
jgi:hypothetical protein